MSIPGKGSREQQRISVSCLNLRRGTSKQLDSIIDGLARLLGQSIVALQECQTWPGNLSHPTRLCYNKEGHSVALLIPNHLARRIEESIFALRRVVVFPGAVAVACACMLDSSKSPDEYT
eukprot:5757251-Alexandrium_andersonii.AAC.1